MIYQFLRQFIRDGEFEQTKVQLTESNKLLIEYKEFLEKQTLKEKNKVDPDFLAFIWVTIGFAYLIFVESAQMLISLQDNKQGSFFIWFILTLFSLFFIVKNSIFALGLTRKYAISKHDPTYISYALLLTVGATLLAVGVIILTFLK